MENKINAQVWLIILYFILLTLVFCQLKFALTLMKSDNLSKRTLVMISNKKKFDSEKLYIY